MYCYLYLFTVLLTLKGERIQSRFRVTDEEGNDAGPRIELNATVLKTGDNLYYICRQDQNKPENFLVKYVPGVGNIKVGTVLKEDVRACTPSDVNYTCTVTSGTIVWDKESAGVCHCQAFPQEIHLIYWINPRWTFSRLDANNDYKKKEMPVGASVFLASHGPLVTATIHKFLPRVHAGRYICNGQFYRYSGHIEPSAFDIYVQPNIKLMNSLNDEFKFVLNGMVKFTCIAWSYPPPLNVNMYVGATPLTNESIGVTAYTETRNSTVGEMKIEVTVVDLTEVFGNESTLSCTSVWSKDGIKQTSKQKTVKVQYDGISESHHNQTPQTLSSSTRFKENNQASSLALFLIVALIVFFGLFLPMLAIFLVLRYRTKKDGCLERHKGRWLVKIYSDHPSCDRPKVLI